MAQPNLLGLPLELRREIYRYLLVKECPLATGAPGFYSQLKIDILRTCKQVYHEALDVLFTENHIKLWLYEPYPSKDQLQSMSRAPRLTIIIKRHCRTPILPAFQTFVDLLVAHHGLKELNVKFDFPSCQPHLLTIQRAQRLLAPLFFIRVSESVSLTVNSNQLLPHFRKLLGDLERSMMEKGQSGCGRIEGYDFVDE
jgi:hypothetical protein